MPGVSKAVKLVALAILLTSGDGVDTKHPTYVLEKFTEVMSCSSFASLFGLMDQLNSFKLENYLNEQRIKH